MGRSTSMVFEKFKEQEQLEGTYLCCPRWVGEGGGISIQLPVGQTKMY